MGFTSKEGIKRLATIVKPLSILLLREDIKKANVFLDIIPTFTIISDYQNFTLKKLASVRIKLLQVMCHAQHNPYFV
jgi:hypothetical protein